MNTTSRRSLHLLAFTLALPLLFAGCKKSMPLQGHNSAQRYAPLGVTPAAGSGDFAAPPQPERPGLATGWGERRESHVAATEFRRANGDSPASTGQVFYNDREGAAAMLAQFGGNPRRVSGLQRQGFVSIGLQDEHGSWLEGWNVRGTTQVIGERNARYAVVVRNETTGRVEIVASVDGLDVLDGKPASYRKRGYILGPGETYAIEGFRTGQDSVAAFRFSSVGQSYAALKHDNTRNVGVIGVAVFAERNEEVVKRREADPFPRSWATAPWR